METAMNSELIGINDIKGFVLESLVHRAVEDMDLDVLSNPMKDLERWKREQRRGPDHIVENRVAVEDKNWRSYTGEISERTFDEKINDRFRDVPRGMRKILIIADPNFSWRVETSLITSDIITIRLGYQVGSTRDYRALEDIKRKLGRVLRGLMPEMFLGLFTRGLVRKVRTVISLLLSSNDEKEGEGELSPADHLKENKDPPPEKREKESSGIRESVGRVMEQLEEWFTGALP